MAFIRRKGNSYFLVHNVREDGKVKQLHLAKLGEHPRITQDVVQKVSRRHPFVNVDWMRAPLYGSIAGSNCSTPSPHMSASFSEPCEHLIWILPTCSLRVWMWHRRPPRDTS